MTPVADENKEPTGYFLFSLDTELAWGHFDNFRPDVFSPDGQRERYAIRRLLDMLDEFGIVATWAVVGHLFYAKCEKCEICPVLEWKGKYNSYNDIYDASSPLWYGADIIRTLIQRSGRHEIAFHGYTHRIFDENTFSREDARVEITEWLRVTQSMQVAHPRTVVFPRNKVGHLDVFKEHGFVCYRGDELLPRDYYSLPLIGKLLNRIDLITQFRTPQIYNVEINRAGLINLPASRGLFTINRKFDMLLDRLNLRNFHIQRIIRGVEKAAKEKKIIHIYAHPFEFRAEKDFEKLRRLFESVADQIKNNRLQSVSMATLAETALRSYAS
ncbi:MAG: polysaccharide deacetylase family protein [Chloroflexi bacterium]|nr:polysaccharide deacetylase family protein [Chloroflexota bacterium]MBI3339403.1 polysaccharide deacetylase family protein [Chloroflexota bacterium]